VKKKKGRKNDGEEGMKRLNKLLDFLGPTVEIIHISRDKTVVSE